MKTIFTLMAIAAVSLLAGCAATPQGATGATTRTVAAEPWCVQGRYGGSDAAARCDRGSTQNSR